MWVRNFESGHGKEDLPKKWVVGLRKFSFFSRSALVSHASLRAVAEFSSFAFHGIMCTSVELNPSGVSGTQKVGVGYFGANINVGAKTRGVCKEQFCRS